MNEKKCPQEDRIRKSLAGGESSPETAAHIASCPVCRDTAAVVSALGRIRNASLDRFAAEGRIPEAAVLLGKFRRRSIPAVVESENILGPIRFYQRFILLAGLIAGIITAALNFNSIKSLLLSLPGVLSLIDGIRSLSMDQGGVSFGLLLAYAVLGFTTLIILAAAMKRWPEKS